MKAIFISFWGSTALVIFALMFTFEKDFQKAEMDILRQYHRRRAQLENMDLDDSVHIEDDYGLELELR